MKTQINNLKDYADCIDASYAMLHYVFKVNNENNKFTNNIHLD